MSSPNYNNFYYEMRSAFNLNEDFLNSNLVNLLVVFVIVITIVGDVRYKLLSNRLILISDNYQTVNLVLRSLIFGIRLRRNQQLLEDFFGFEDQNYLLDMTGQKPIGYLL